MKDVIACRNAGNTIHSLFLQWHMEYGAIFVCWFMHFPFIVVTDPEMVKDILVASNLPKHFLAYSDLGYLFGQRFLGNGLATNVDNENWKRRRGIMNPAFHRKYLKDLMISFNATADLLIAHLGKMADGKTEVCLLEQFGHAALDIICKVTTELVLFSNQVSAYWIKYFDNKIKLNTLAANQIGDKFHKESMINYKQIQVWEIKTHW